MSADTRERALSILCMPMEHSALTIHNAIVDLRHNAASGDEELLQSYLDFPDDMVVSATLFAMIHVYRHVPSLLELLLQFAEGDSRDSGEMPIQTQAIEGLALYAPDDHRALAKLLSVARSKATPEAPRARAWKCLADLFGVPWKSEYTYNMIWDPESESSQAIRDTVITAVENRKSEPHKA